MSARWPRVSTIPGVGAERASDGDVQPVQAYPMPPREARWPALSRLRRAPIIGALADLVGFRARLIAVAGLKG